MKLATIIPLAILLIGLVILLKKGSYEEREFEINGKKLTVEIADTEKKRAKGLMFRTHLDYDKGMLFIFPTESKHKFWMANTKIPLDMIWLDKNFEVIHVEKNVPPCTSKVLVNCPSYGPETPAKYVLEVNAGWWKEE